MAKSGQSRAQANKAIRQQALREQLEAQGHLQHIVDILGVFMDLEHELDGNAQSRYKTTMEVKLKLLNKYLPDLKATELTGELDLNTLYKPIIKRFDGTMDEDA